MFYYFQTCGLVFVRRSLSLTLSLFSLSPFGSGIYSTSLFSVLIGLFLIVVLALSSEKIHLKVLYIEINFCYEENKWKKFLLLHCGVVVVVAPAVVVIWERFSAGFGSVFDLTRTPRNHMSFWLLYSLLHHSFTSKSQLPIYILLHTIPKMPFSYTSLLPLDLSF